MPKLIIRLTEKMTVEIQHDDAKAMIREAAFWGDIPDKCPVCGAAIKFTYREPKKIYKYYGLACEGAPSHKIDLGEHLDGGRLFYRQSEPWGSYSNGNKTVHDAAANEGKEPTAEHERLEKLIVEKWKEQSRSMPIEDAVKKKFKKTLGELSIADKRKVLESLEQ